MTYNNCVIGVVGMALNLCAYDFVSEEIRAAEDPEFETFYTKNINMIYIILVALNSLLIVYMSSFG